MLKQIIGFAAIILLLGGLFISCSDDGTSSTEPVINETLSCEIITPSSNQEIVVGSVGVINVNATDENGIISNVRFYLDNIGIEVDSTFPYTCNFNTSNYAYGNHIVKAIAENEKGIEKSTSIIIVMTGSAPTGFFTINPETPQLFSDLKFDASNCTDLQDNDSLLQVRWDFDGDGNWDTGWSIDKIATHSFNTSGTFTTKLSVKDSDNEIGTYEKDITFSNSMQIIASENFDGLNAGEGIVAQGNNNWKLWPGGQAHDALITSDFVFSQTNSMQVVDSTDVFYDLNNLRTGKYVVKFKMYVERGFLGYYNMLSSNLPDGYVFEMFFDSTEVMFKTVDPFFSKKVEYKQNEWIDIVNYIDLDSNFAKVFMNDSMIYEFEWAFIDSNRRLGAIDFYGWKDNMKTSKAHIDDFIFEKVIE